MQKCPYCSSIVDNDSENCPVCNEKLKIQCPYCKEYINVNERVCPICSTKLMTNSISLLAKITYFLLLINALLPYWFNDSFINHPTLWHEIITAKDGFEDLVSCFISILIISVIPSFIGIVSNYRKRFFSICIIAFILFCIFNLILLCRIVPQTV